MIKSRRIHSRRRRFGYSLVLAGIAASTLLIGSALSSPGLAMAEPAQNAPPVISVNIGSHGIYWNGNKVDALSLQHRSLIAARINPRVPVLLTVSAEVSDAEAADAANTLHQSGLMDIETKRINTAVLAGGAEDGDRLMQYRAQRRPKYPLSALRNKHEGTVIVHVHFAADGTALGALVQATTASTDLIKSSLAATLSWRTGVGENSWKRIPVKYELHKIRDLPDMQASQEGQKLRMSTDGTRIEAVPKRAATN